MHNEQEGKFEKRIRFVARHYYEGGLDTEEAWKRLAVEKEIVRKIPFRKYLLAVASVALLLLGITSIYLQKKAKPEWVSIVTASGQFKDVYLPDSTLVNMAGSSQIRYNVKTYGRKGREVEMSGKAFFQVAYDESCPFSVQAKWAEVEVLGTTFLIQERETSVEVNVSSGKVKFSAGEGEKEKRKNIILTKGMSANFSMETQEINLLKEEKSNFLSWKTGILRFHHTPLEEVIEDLTDYYNVPIKSRVRLRGEKLTATFESLPVDQVLLIINQTLDVHLFVEKEAISQ